MDRKSRRMRDRREFHYRVSSNWQDSLNLYTELQSYLRCIESAGFLVAGKNE